MYFESCVAYAPEWGIFFWPAKALLPVLCGVSRIPGPAFNPFILGCVTPGAVGIARGSWSVAPTRRVMKAWVGPPGCQSVFESPGAGAGCESGGAPLSEA